MSVLMAAGRSSFSWDIIVNRVGDKLFLDKRVDCPIDYVTCNETVQSSWSRAQLKWGVAFLGVG